MPILLSFELKRVACTSYPLCWTNYLNKWSSKYDYGNCMINGLNCLSGYLRPPLGLFVEFFWRAYLFLRPCRTHTCPSWVKAGRWSSVTERGSKATVRRLLGSPELFPWAPDVLTFLSVSGYCSGSFSGMTTGSVWLRIFPCLYTQLAELRPKLTVTFL